MPLMLVWKLSVLWERFEIEDHGVRQIRPSWDCHLADVIDVRVVVDVL